MKDRKKRKKKEKERKLSPRRNLSRVIREFK